MDFNVVKIVAIIAIAVVGIAFFFNRAAVEHNASQEKLAIECVKAGGSWIESRTGFQCVVK